MARPACAPFCLGNAGVARFASARAQVHLARTLSLRRRPAVPVVASSGGSQDADEAEARGGMVVRTRSRHLDAGAGPPRGRGHLSCAVQPLEGACRAGRRQRTNGTQRGILHSD